MSKPQQHTHNKEKHVSKPEANAKKPEAPKPPPGPTVEQISKMSGEELSKPELVNSLTTDEQKTAWEAAVKVNAAKNQAEKKKKEPKHVQVPVSHGPAMREGSAKLFVFKKFSLPPNEAQTAEQIGAELAKLYPAKSADQHTGRVNQLVGAFKRVRGLVVGRDEQGRLSTHIQGTAQRPLTEEQKKALAEKLAKKEAGKAAKAEVKAKAAAEKATAKQAAEKAKAEAAEKAKSEAAAKVQVPDGPKVEVAGQLKK